MLLDGPPPGVRPPFRGGLMNVLLVKFEIPSDLRYINGLPRIYIKKANVNRVRDLVRPFIIPSMLYKLGI